MYPLRYLAGLSPSMKLVRKKELLRRKKSGSFKLGRSNKVARTRTSRWTTLFHKTYPGLPFIKSAISKRTGIPIRSLDTVYNRGRRAWQTSGSRPGATANQWGVARVYKFVLVSKRKAPRSWYASRPDPDDDLRLKYT